MDEGEKYLTVQILGGLRVACFKTKEKKNPKEPDYKGNGVAVWINKKKANPKQTEEIL